MSKDIICKSCGTLLIVLASGSKVSPNKFSCYCLECNSKIIAKAIENSYMNGSSDCLSSLMGIFK